MKPISYARHRFPPDVIRHAVWLYLRFTLSYRDVEDLLAERGLIVSNESIRRWVLKFGPVIAKNLRTSRPKACPRWHLDEMVVSLSGRCIQAGVRHWLVSDDGEPEIPKIRCMHTRPSLADTASNAPRIG
jgi:transposase-like protein